MNIAFINHKGGIGKTTLAVNTAFRSRELKKRLLLLDCDEQCNSLQLFSGYDWSKEQKWTSDNYVMLGIGHSNVKLNIEDRFDNILFDCPPSEQSATNFLSFLQKNGLNIDIWIIPIESRMSITGADTIIHKIRKAFPQARIVLVFSRCVSGEVTQADRAEAARFPNVELCKIVIPASSVGLNKFEQRGGQAVWYYYTNRTATRMKMFCETLLKGMPIASVFVNGNNTEIDADRKLFITTPINKRVEYGKW